MIGFNLLHFVPLDEGAEEISTGCNHGLGRAGRYLDKDDTN